MLQYSILNTNAIFILELKTLQLILVTAKQRNNNRTSNFALLVQKILGCSLILTVLIVI